MKTQFSKLALTAVLGLVITFTLSCSSPDDNKDGGNEPSNGGSSSPSGGGVVPSPCPNAVTGDGTMSCGGQTYGTVVIGDQTWMAKNLNYKVSGSKCYGNAESDCNKFGRLYDWETAEKVCPAGWHLPSSSDWRELESYVESDNGCRSCAGKLLKAKSNNGTDTYGFSALPSGSSDGCGWAVIGDSGCWWSASEGSDRDDAVLWSIYSDRDQLLSRDWYKTNLHSVRCLKD